ncbi:MAG: hypothetical protein A2289_14745 [Deltaproteobacteria bacterium RIFOXYA12_FULL_58_15]|nr:MAG: hypothetical protein A2289_14745 [Deltaproteobacteria bacterium RIFOXYA12_FULL_58_15]
MTKPTDVVFSGTPLRYRPFGSTTASRNIEASMLKSLITLLIVFATACASKESSPCLAKNHCVLQDGDARCEEGYAWRSNDPEDLVCVAMGDCGPCQAPAVSCDGDYLVVSEVAGCKAGECVYTQTPALCVNGCDDILGACLGCNNPCDSNTQTQCAAGSLSTCTLDALGCWSWGEAEPCESGVCQDSHSCRDGPTISRDLCTVDGWCPVVPQPFGGALWALWSDGEILWVAAEDGGLYHYNGTSWSAFYLDFYEEVYAMWGSAANDIWAVGKAGLILHFDGSLWQRWPMLYQRDLHSVWGSAADNVYAAGDGVFLHFDGDSWSAPDDVWASGLIAGIDADNFCVAATTDRFNCWNGSNWVEEYGPYSGDVGNPSLTAMSVTAAGVFWAATLWGELLLRGDDGYWRPAATSHEDGDHVWASRDGSLWRLNDRDLQRQVDGSWQSELELPCDGAKLFEDNLGTTWVGGDCGFVSKLDDSDSEDASAWLQLSGFDQRFHHLENLAAGPDGSLWAAGDQTARFADGTWTFWQHEVAITNLEWIGSELMALGLTPSFEEQLLRWNGSGWQVLWQGTLDDPIYGAKLWGLSPEDVYVLVEPLHHWDGTSLEVVPNVGYVSGLHGLSAESLWGVRDTYTSIMRYDGDTWNTLYGHGWAGSALTSVWVFAEDDVWFHGDIGSFIHWDGTHFTGHPSPGLSFGDMMVPGAPGTLWAASQYSGNNSTLMYFDGHGWELQRHAAGAQIRDIAHTSLGTWLLGRGQLRFRQHPAEPCIPETANELCLGGGFSCGTWLTTDTCGHKRQVVCGDCSTGECSAAGHCVLAPAPILDCSTTGAGALATTGSVTLSGRDFVGLCGSEIVFVPASQNNSIVHFDVATETELHSLSFTEDVRQISVDQRTGTVVVRTESLVHLVALVGRVGLTAWQATSVALAGDAENMALGEPGELFVDVFRLLPGEHGMGQAVLQTVDLATGEVRHTTPYRGFQGGTMHYDAKARQLFVYGWYSLHKLAYDPREGLLHNLEEVDDLGDYCSAVLAPEAHKYVAYCSLNTVVVVDTDYMVHSTNGLLPSPFDNNSNDNRNRSFPAVALSGTELVVQKQDSLEWIDLSSFEVNATVALVACDPSTLGKPFYSQNGSILYAAAECSSEWQLRWIVP